MEMRCNHCGRLLNNHSDLYINVKTENSVGCGGCLTVTNSGIKKKCPVCKVVIDKGELALCKVELIRPLQTAGIRTRYTPVACIDCYTMVQPNAYIPTTFGIYEGVEWY